MRQTMKILLFTYEQNIDVLGIIMPDTHTVSYIRVKEHQNVASNSKKKSQFAKILKKITTKEENHG